MGHHISILSSAIDHRSSTPGLLRVVVVLFGLAGILASWAFIPPTHLILRTWLSSLVALAILWFWIWRRYRGHLLPSTDVLVVLGFSVLQLAPPLYLSVRVGVDPWNVADMYPLVALVTAIGAIAFMVGFEAMTQVAAEPPSSPLTSKAPVSWSPHILLLVGCAVWLARGLLLAFGGYYRAFIDSSFVFGRWYSICAQVSSYGLFISVALWLRASLDPRWRVWALLALVAEFVWIIPSGNREGALRLLLIILLLIWWSKKRVPWREIAVVGIVVMFAMPILGQYRYSIADYTDVDRASLSGTVHALNAAQTVRSQAGDDTILRSLDSIIARLYDGQYLGYLLKHYRESYDWELGNTYFARLLFVFVPYFLYPHRVGLQVPISFWFKLVDGGAAPSTLLGEAFVNLGYMGVPFIAFTLGIILAIYDVALQKRRGDALVAAVYLFAGSNMPFMVTQSFTSWLAYLRNVVIFIVILRLAAHISVSRLVPRRAMNRLLRARKR